MGLCVEFFMSTKLFYVDKKKYPNSQRENLDYWYSFIIFMGKTQGLLIIVIIAITFIISFG